MPYLILSAGRDPNLLKQHNAVLAAHGYQITSASDSGEVVDKLLNGDFDLVLLCNSMPEEDRCRLARIINAYTPSTPVVLISELQKDGDESGARTLHCRPDQIVQAVTGSLRGSALFEVA